MPPVHFCVSVMPMRTRRKTGGFFVSLLINLLLNLEWSIPAWILLALHIWLDVSLWWFVGGLAFTIGVRCGIYISDNAIDKATKKILHENKRE